MKSTKFTWLNSRTIYMFILFSIAIIGCLMLTTDFFDSVKMQTVLKMPSSVKRQLTIYMLGLKYRVEDDDITHYYKIQKQHIFATTDVHNFVDCADSYMSTAISRDFFEKASLDSILCNLHYVSKNLNRSSAKPDDILTVFFKRFCSQVTAQKNNEYFTLMFHGEQFSITINFVKPVELNVLKILEKESGKVVCGFFFNLPFNVQLLTIADKSEDEMFSFLAKYLLKIQRPLYFPKFLKFLDTYFYEESIELDIMPLVYRDVLIKKTVDYILDYYN